jgi:peptide/nickel transport system substrate-binding protein
VIQSALKDVGFPVQLDPLPQTQMTDRRTVKKDLPMSINDQEKPLGPDVAYATMLFFVSPAAGGVNNVSNYSNPEVDRLFGEAKVEQDNIKRLDILKQIQETLQKDLAWIPLAETKTEWAFSDKLSGVTWHPENSIHFIDLSMQ